MQTVTFTLEELQAVAQCLALARPSRFVSVADLDAASDKINKACADAQEGEE